MEQVGKTCVATDVLTVRQALDAMIRFLEEYYRQTQSDDVGSLLGELPFGDPAAWTDWLLAVQRAVMLETPELRDMLASLVADPQSFAGRDRGGGEWYGRILPDGSQLWAYVYHGTIRCAGCNRAPRSFDPQFGLSAAYLDAPAPHDTEPDRH